MIYLIATPIGNLEDVTLRALRVLREVDFILAEDTRKTGVLLKHYSIDQPMYSFHDHNEQSKIPRIIKELKSGKNAALVSSAGAPTISDPGYKLVRECKKQNLHVTSLPGPSSVINALTLSAVAHDKFAFLGYFPRKAGDRRRLLEKTKEWGCAIVFFESPHRIFSCLSEVNKILGNREITIAREMTKKFEEVLETTIEEAIEHFKDKKPKGELTIVIKG
ncbi:MAG: 16S rRNA (cytidine(1402)-2'-O)-methyltransferase [Candidatus Omnitrophica bacterium]|nr:16S rRNA (cytidine(1402)-2'-O)-methyltransferase [Candidatus Omnitrophota bacterium]